MISTPNQEQPWSAASSYPILEKTHSGENFVTTITDLIVLGVFVFFAVIGLLKGFFRTIIGPLSSTIGISAGYFYYMQYGRLANALILALGVPIVLSIVLSIVLFIWRKTADKESTLTWPSRLAGSLLNGFWGLCLMLPFVLFLAIMPAPVSFLEKIKNDALDSSTYSLMKNFIQDKTTAMKGAEIFFKTPVDSPKMESIRQRPDFQAVQNDPNIRDIVSDEETIRQIREKDIFKLLANPKFVKLLENKETLKKLYALSENLGADTEDMPTAAASKKSRQEYPEPKVYEFKDGTKIQEMQNGTMAIIP